MKPVDLKQKDVCVPQFCSPYAHPQCEPFTAVNVKNFTLIYRKTEPAHRRKNFAEHTIISDPGSPEM